MITKMAPFAHEMFKKKKNSFITYFFETSIALKLHLVQLDCEINHSNFYPLILNFSTCSNQQPTVSTLIDQIVQLITINSDQV